MPEQALETVVLVDARDCEMGTCEKQEAHRSGLLHRAFSVMIFDPDDRLLMQRRQAGKYHSGGLWANSCCGHPRPGEDVRRAARRRLREELGFSCDLAAGGTLIYRAGVGRGLVEHELVHIFGGRYEGPVSLAPDECDAYRWVGVRLLADEVSAAPSEFAAWFKEYLALGWPLQPPR